MSFLRNIAQTYYKQYGDSLRSLVFVFQNRRAGLFFRKYLSEVSAHPVFSPRILTIEQLFQEFSPLKTADPIDLLFRLYEVYQREYLTPRGEDESFDNFVFWGRMMLADFNDIDSHMVDAEKLFTTLGDYKDIEQRFSTLSDEAQESLRIFLHGFQTGGGNHYREKFLHLWRALLPIYNGLRSSLLSDGLAYSGMLAREVVENIAEEQILAGSKRYVFVGFNALNGAQKVLLGKLQTAGVADFCWDYGHPFLSDPYNRASLFMHENMRMFPGKQDIDTPTATMPEIHLIEVSSSVGQASQLTTILSQIAPEVGQDWTKVGIVLPNENMLGSVRRTIPACVSSMNITMGEPLAGTPITSLLMHLSEIQLLCRRSGKVTLFYHRPVLALLSHPYITGAVEEEILKDMQVRIQEKNMTYVPQTFFEESPLLAEIFTPQDDAASAISWLQSLLLKMVNPETDALEQNEYIYQTLLQVNRLSDLYGLHPSVTLTTKTVLNLLIELVKSVRVPFEGEPLAGLQIMGMLESRGMDFSHILITDVNEDTLPGSSVQQSYIPYDLRIAYGLPTPERQDAIFAYNFYRLISCAQHVWLLQNTTANDMRSGEASRYVSQLKFQYNLPINKQTVDIKALTQSRELQQITKDKNIMRELTETLCPAEGEEEKKGLSPSALNTYMACPLQFYFRHIRHLHEAEKIDEEIADNVFGTIVHAAMQQLYEPFRNGGTVTVDNINNMLLKLKQTDFVERIYKKEQLRNEHAVIEGKDSLPIHVMQHYIEHALQCDKALAPFVYIDSELKCNARIEVAGIGNVYISGIIDRIDRVGNTIRIIDYKTGKRHSTFNNIESLFVVSQKQNESDHVRQTLIYCLLAYAKLQTSGIPKTGKDDDFVPYIYYVREKADNLCQEITPKDGTMHGYHSMKEDFEKSLKDILREILNFDVPFVAREGKHCDYCPFRQLCQ